MIQLNEQQEEKDTRNWFAKLVNKLDNETWLEAFGYIFYRKFLYKVRRFTRKQYFINIKNAIVDNHKLDLYDLSYDFRTTLLNKIVPNMVKIFSEHHDLTFNTIPALGINTEEAFNKLLKLWEEIMELDYGYWEFEAPISAALNAKDNDRYMELLLKYNTAVREKYVEYGTLLWHLLPHMWY